MSIFGATVIGGLITAISNWALFRGRSKWEFSKFDRETDRDHARWLREKRLIAYERFLVDADFTSLSLRRAGPDKVKFTNEDYETALQALAAVGLVGPIDLYQLAMTYQESAHAEIKKGGDKIGWNVIVASRTRVAARMQEVLAVPAAERMTAKEEED